MIQTARTSPAAGRPPIHLIDADYDVIAGLALGIERRAPALSRMLMDEIDRAEIHARDSVPAGIVSIGSEVEFLDVERNTRRKVRLVLPGEADIEAGRISILTPVGAGLIGLARGQSIDWPCPNGRARVLKILSVTPPAAR